MKIIFLFIILLTQVYAGKIVVNTNNHVKELSQSEIKQIFKIRKLNWKNGNTISVYMLPSASKVQDSFTSKYFSIDSNQFYDEWMQYILNGGMNRPPHFLNERKLIRKVKRNVNSIGIVSDTATLPATVKVIHTFKETN